MKLQLQLLQSQSLMDRLQALFISGVILHVYVFDSYDRNYSKIPFNIKKCLIKTRKSISNPNQSTGLNIDGFSLKCMFLQTLRKMIKGIHLNSVASGQRNKFFQLQKLPCSRMGKHITQIKFSPSPNFNGDGVKFLILNKFHILFHFFMFYLYKKLI